ncbi:MAG: translocated intimin receptor Tir [Gemmatimonadaceae bacterium]|nr:translocated intimin receptor Tir [Gemmatimonadaceae bacterium]
MNANSGDGSHTRLSSILRDAQFWIPVIVLAGGLVVLEWIR